MKINNFEELQIWKDSIQQAKEIYSLTSNVKFSKDFSLRDQIRRAIVSVSSNIVEGFERSNNNEFIRFLKIAKGSLGEVRSQLYLATVLNYVGNRQQDALDKKLMELSTQIGKFISYLETKRKNKEFLTH